MKYLKIKEQLLTYLEKLEIGEKLQSRKDLCEKFQTTSSTLTKAFAELEAEGYIESIKGTGTFKSNKIPKKGNFLEGTENWGIITLDISTRQYSAVMKGISDEATKNGINLIFCNSNFDESMQSQFIKRMINSNVDGLIIVPIINPNWKANQDMYRDLQKANVPFVFCHRGCPGVDAPIVKKNDFFGAYIQAKYLLENGCKKIIYVSNTKYQISIERIQGFVSAVLEKGANFERKDVVISTTNYERIESIVEQALINDPSIDGICCFCDPLAPYIYKAISHVGKKVGKDIKVIGYDDTELCETLEPKLTSIGYNSYKMGEICAQLLYKLTHGYKLGEFDFFLQEPEIVRRKSCGE